MLLRLIVKSLSDILFITILILLSLGIGNRVWPFLFGGSDDPLRIIEEGIFSIAIGLGILSIIILATGISGFLYPWVVFVIFIIMLFLLFPTIRDYFIMFFSNVKRYYKSPILHQKSLLILLPIPLFALVLLILFTRVPPVFYDALVYHLGVPNQYIIRHAIGFIPYSFHSHHPFLIQNIFTLCLLLGGITTPKLINLAFVILIAISLSTLAFKLTNRPFSSLSGIILFLTPTMLIMGSLVNVDIGFSLYTLLAIYALFTWMNQYKSDSNKKLKDKRTWKKENAPSASHNPPTNKNDRAHTENQFILQSKKHQDNWLILSAILTGFALGTKYTSIIYCLGLNLISIFIFLVIKKCGMKETSKKVLIFLLISILIGSCWYIKNLYWTKNPFYPKWADTWGEPKIQSCKIKMFQASAHAYNHSDSIIKNIISLPLRLMLHPEEFGVGGNIGIIFFLLLPLALIPERKNKLYLHLLLYCLLYYILWAFSFRMTRFAIPLFAILILLSTLTLDRICCNKRKWIKYMVIIILMLGLSYNIYYSANLFGHIYTPWQYLSGKETEEAYLTRHIKSYPLFEYINENLPGDSRILFIGETINFYCNRMVIAPTVFDTNPIVTALKTRKRKVGIYNYLRGLGITHLLINFDEMNRTEAAYKAFQLTEEERRIFYELLDSAQLLYRSGKVLLIELGPYN